MAPWLVAVGVVAGQPQRQTLLQQPLVAATVEERTLERWLEERELLAPLAWLLESVHARAAEEDREAVARKLASVYAAQLDRVRDEALRRRVEESARRLLSSASGPAARELRLTLLRARYSGAERMAERWLMALEDEQARAAAVESLRAVAAELADEALQANRRIASLSKQEEALSGEQARRASALIAEEQRRRSLASYLGGWAQTYVALLTGSHAAAEQGLTLLEQVLFGGQAPQGEKDPVEDFDVGLLRFEHVARAAVAAALCRAELGDAAGADRWFETLDRAEATPASVRQQLVARRLLALATLRRWSEFTRLLSQTKTLRPAQARLAAALSLREATRSRDPAVRVAARRAVERLARMGLLEHALDLAQRFQSDALAEQGFVGLYAKAARLFRQAQEQRRSDPDAAKTHARTAATLAERALALPDVPKTLRYAAATLAASAWNMAARTDEERAVAAELFEQAYRVAPDDQARGEALWGAIAALALGGDVQKRSALIDRFLAAFPTHRRYGAVALEASRLAGVDPVAAAERLLRTPLTDERVAEARARAAALLFDAQRGASPHARAAIVKRYLEVATGLLAVDLPQVARGDAAAAQRVLARAQRILEAATTVSPVDVAAAQRAFEAVEMAARTGLVDVAAAQDELDERRVRMLLARGELDDAAALAQTLRRRSPDSIWAVSATWLVARKAAARWRRVSSAMRSDDAQRIAEEAAQRARALLRAATPLLEEPTRHGAEEEALAPVAAAAAEAAFFLWRRDSEDSALLEQAWRTNERVMALLPREKEALRRRGKLAMARGDAAAALEAWRTLSAALPQDDEVWFEARLGVVEALERLDGARARAVLAQHLAMHPELGPPSLRSRFEAAAERLGLAVQTEGRPGAAASGARTPAGAQR